MAPEAKNYSVDFPTLFIVPAWIQRHCVIPDGFRKGRPFKMYDWQLWVTLNHYRIRPGAKQTPGFGTDPDVIPIRSAAFVYRRSQVIAPQKTGKGPWAAAITAAEAVGPVLFLGWAKGGEQYDCADNGCECGWIYTYLAGEPMGHAWATPLIQLLATSEDQVDNVYKPLKGMARGERLRDRMKVREGFIRIAGEDDDPEACRIDVVTSSAKSRLGNPITFCIQDETQLYTAHNKLITVAETMRRGCAAMGGRSIETTNCYDPGENSVAQRTHEGRAQDVFKFYEPPPVRQGDKWKFTIKAERRRIFAYNYAGSPHADLEGIIAEAEELVEKDPAQAERFFGNRLVQGLGTWLPDGLWASRGPAEGVTARVIPDGTRVCLGFDGSDSDDCTAIRLRTVDGYRFTPTYGPDKRPTFWDPAEWGGSIPRGEVNAAVDEICRRFKVKRAYCDPRDWQSEIGDWALKHGDKVFLEWATYRTKQMHEALVRVVNDLKSGRTTHDGCPITTLHVGNARKVAQPAERYILGKPHGAYHQKIDMAMADVLAHIAGEDALADGWATPKTESFIYLA